MKRFKALSLFANVGIAETYLKDAGVDVVVSNEFIKKRAAFYSEMYPQSEMICGDITDPCIREEIITKSAESGVDLIMATPPCQGMSMAGKRNPWDERNTLICHAVSIIKDLSPKYAFIENVTEIFRTCIMYHGKEILVTDFIKAELGSEYNICARALNAADFGVPQSRKRAIFLLSRNDMPHWDFPDVSDIKRVTLEEAIGYLPSVDPKISDADYSTALNIFPEYESKRKAAMLISQYHRPPRHPMRQVIAMLHTPEGRTALDNEDIYKPRRKDGSVVKAFRTAYKRQEWKKPAATVTMYNGSISSQLNVHPGRYIGTDDDGNALYSEPRVLTLYELFLVTSLPSDWTPPTWASETLLRKVIGEGIPPLMVKKIMENIPEVCD